MTTHEGWIREGRVGGCVVGCSMEAIGVVDFTRRVK